LQHFLEIGKSGLVSSKKHLNAPLAIDTCPVNDAALVIADQVSSE
jgi:hypothetical protein